MCDKKEDKVSLIRGMPSWRDAGKWLLGSAVGFVAMLLIWVWIFSPQIPLEAPPEPEDASFYSAARAEQHLPDEPPIIHLDVDYGEESSAAWWPKGESPLITELVTEGLLPPLHERVGPEPLVLQGVDGIGNYGGTWLRLANSYGDVSILTDRLSGVKLFRWSPMGYPIKPHLAKGYSVNEDRSEWTVYLRKGVRWSDGHPFTADDIIYWWEGERKYFEPTNPGAFMRVGAEFGDIIKLDDYTVSFVFPGPNGLLLEHLTRVPMFSPRHYMEQFHPERGDPELIAAGMRASGINSSRMFYFSMQSFRNPEHPRLWPWIYRTYRSSSPENFVRNPYFWAVDPEGNQLPYLDRLTFDVKNRQLIPISAAAGDVTMQGRDLRFDNYTMLMENRSSGNYDVYHWYSSSRADWVLSPNINRRGNDTISVAKAEFLRERDFRRALSLAIDRQTIIDSLYSGVGYPAHPDPGPESPFSSPEFRFGFVDFDPQRADKLLDGIGLTRRDHEGMRTLPDGSRLTFYIDFSEFTGEGPVQFVVEDWGRVGIRAIPRERSRALFFTRRAAGQSDFIVWSGESEYVPMLEPRNFVPVTVDSNYAPFFGRWFLLGGIFDPDSVDITGVGILEPELGSIERRNMELYSQALGAADFDTQIDLFREMASNAAGEAWTIAISSPPPSLVVVQNGFRNVPEVAITGWVFSSPSNAGIETFFFDEPYDSPGAIARIKEEMITITPDRRAIDTTTFELVGDDRFGKVLRRIILFIAIAGIVLAGFRHPYIGRRLIVLVPTLLIIAVGTFYIIQLPPGDFIEIRVMELEATGDAAAAEEIARLRDLFHLDRPISVQFSYWLGLPWFYSFDSSDKGLLQGNMGRSMETGGSVNELVGDRLALTFWVSLGTLLFTWVIALPIGIYSAVRQYSPVDYVLTFIGFIGMCLPNFLLAILLMYWSGQYLGINVTGLFSPEYAMDPEWTFGKVLDLLKHIWVPIVVIATAGTAGMIRVMRANLLDELEKPYVRTARAKGVRPFKLLIKYPVRMALNPFISGIGGIFPHLISGGAIVAIVLSLPMIGPLLLDGLLAEDIYVAASMLMVLSLLSVLGTLISDLLLLWLDPRIRMEGGTR